MGVLINSCEVAEDPEISKNQNERVDIDVDNSLVVNTGAEEVHFYDDFETVQLNGYIIKFNRVLEEVDSENNIVSTTFEYAISGTGETAQMDSFYLQVPTCAGTTLEGWFPTNSSKLEENRIKWNHSISKDAVEEIYSVTYRGQVKLGIIEVFVVKAGIQKKSIILGPCGGYDISGSVFIDNEGPGLGTFEASETGVGEIEVQLGGAEYSSKANTAEDGLYQFRVLSGTYNVSVTNGADLFKDGNYINSQYAPVTLQVDDHIAGVDFGYLVDSDKVIGRFESGQILLNTLSTKSWLQEVRNAGKGNSLYKKTQIAEFLWKIQEETFEEETFDFGLLENRSNIDAAIAVAVDLLSRPIKTEKDLFVQQLLTAELNVVAQRGALLSGTRELNSKFNNALLMYAEAKACQDFQICAPESDFLKSSATIKAVSSRLLTSFNENGSGGL